MNGLTIQCSCLMEWKEQFWFFTKNCCVEHEQKLFTQPLIMFYRAVVYHYHYYYCKFYCKYFFSQQKSPRSTLKVQSSGR